MAKKDADKSTKGIDVSNIPNETLKKIDDKVAKLGTTRSGYIKGLINADLKADNMDKFNRVG
jgi:hypothetical protein